MIEKSINEIKKNKPNQNCANCAVTTFKKVSNSINLNSKDAVIVAGLAGGVGLLGNICAALAVGVFALAAKPYLDQKSRRRDSQIFSAFQELSGSANRGKVDALRQAFIKKFKTDSCVKIAGRRFKTIEEHSDFIQGGGCQEVINFIAKKIDSMLV